MQANCELRICISQGWKLFAEAHRIQAGDQVSFELVAAKRMVVQVIRAADTPACKKGYAYPQKARAPKAHKVQGDSSPQRSQQYFCDSDEVRPRTLMYQIAIISQFAISIRFYILPETLFML